MSCASIDCGFSCKQTPLHIDGTSDITDLSGVKQQYPTGNGNATARLWTIHSGTGLLSYPTDGSSGVFIDENIQDTFTFYGISYTLIEVRLFYGQHVLFPLTDVSGQCNVPKIIQNSKFTAAPLEVYCFFKNNNNNIVCLVLPIGIGDGGSKAATYLSALSSTAGSPPPPPLSTLFQDLSGANSSAFNANNMVLYYTGQDIRKYTSYTTCDPTSISNPVQYLFIMNDINGTKKISSTISLTVYNTLLNGLNRSYLQLINQITGITSGDINKLKFLPVNALYVINTVGGANTINVNSLKCYPINPKKEIRNKQIYLDENGRPTNIECPSDKFTFFTNNGNYFCCNGTVKDNVCTATAENSFCGLNEKPMDPITNKPILTCDELKNKLSTGSTSTVPTNFWTSAAGIETIIAIVIGCTFGLGFLFFAARSFFSSKTPTPPTSVAGTAATAARAAASAAAATAAATATAAKSGKSIYDYISVNTTIALVILLFASSCLAVIFGLLYFGK